MSFNYRKFMFVMLVGVMALGLGSSVIPRAQAVITPTYTLDETVARPGANFQWMELDDQGNLYISDFSHDQIWVFDSNQVNTHNITGFNSPEGLDSHNGLLYIAETSAGNLSVVQNNVIVNSTPLSQGRGVKVAPNGRIYASSLNENTVYVYTPDFILRDTILGIIQPEGIAFAPDGRVFVASYGRDNISIFGPDHTFLGSFGSTGTGLGEFDGIFGINVNPDGYLFVAERDNDRVQVFSPDNQLVAVFYGMLSTKDAEPDGVGGLFISSAANDNFTIWTTTDLGDQDGPAITDVTLTPLNPQIGQDVTVTATVADLSGVDTVTLTYQLPGGNTTTVAMSSASDTYSVVIPAATSNGTVTVSIFANDTSLAHHTTTVALDYVVPADPAPPPGNLLPIDPTILGAAGIGLGVVAVVIALTRRGSA